MHEDVLELLLGGKRKSSQPPVIADGSLFWIVSFIIPAAFFTVTGTNILGWVNYGTPVGTSLTIGTVYGLFQLYRALSNITRASGPMGIEGAKELEV